MLLIRPSQHRVTIKRCGLYPISNMLVHFLRILRLQKRVFKGVYISKPSSSPFLQKILHIEEMLVFMHKYIKQILDVKGDSNCGYHAVSTLLGKGEENHTLVLQQLHKEFKTHNISYTTLYRKKEHFDAIHVYFIPYVSGPTPEEKWLCFLKIGNLKESSYNIICINMTRYGFSETFFTL